MRARLAGLIVIFSVPLLIALAESGAQQYIVRLKGAGIGALNKPHGVRTIRQAPNTSTYLIEVDGEDALQDLKEDKRVESAEKNRSVKLSSRLASPISPSLIEQMAQLPDGQTLTTFYGTVVLKSYVEQPAVQITGLGNARNLSTGAGARVAYIDTGVDFDHPALRPWLDPGVDLVNDRSASELDGLSQAMASLLDQGMASLLDRRFFFLLNQAMASLLDGGNGDGAFPSQFGHGTLVAGLIHLFAPEARIAPIKAFDANGNTTMFTIIEAVYRARDLNADVLNMSFSIDDYSETLSKTISEVRASGTVVVASVGNDGSEATSLYPAAYPVVIGVAATDFADRLAGFSNYGKSVAVSAPGAYVVSTVPGGRYAAAWGTSFSAPIVSGAVALLASSRGHGYSDSALALTTADFIDHLNPGFEKKLGKGRINVGRALAGGQ